MGGKPFQLKCIRYPTYARAIWLELFCSSRISIPAPTTPASAVAKIFGLLTATEFACSAVPYASALSLLVYREMDLKGLYDVLLDTG